MSCSFFINFFFNLFSTTPSCLSAGLPTVVGRLCPGLPAEGWRGIMKNTSSLVPCPLSLVRCPSSLVPCPSSLVPRPSSLLLLLQQPESEEHQEYQHTRCSKKKSSQEFLNRCKQTHRNGNDEINNVEEDQIINSFVHGCCFFFGKYRNKNKSIYPFILKLKTMVPSCSSGAFSSGVNLSCLAFWSAMAFIDVLPVVVPLGWMATLITLPVASILMSTAILAFSLKSSSNDGLLLILLPCSPLEIEIPLPPEPLPPLPV